MRYSMVLKRYTMPYLKHIMFHEKRYFVCEVPFPVSKLLAVQASKYRGNKVIG